MREEKVWFLSVANGRWLGWWWWSKAERWCQEKDFIFEFSVWMPMIIILCKQNENCKTARLPMGAIRTVAIVGPTI